MDADPRDQRLRELEAENAALRAQVQTQAERIPQLQQLIRKLQDRIEELERAAARQAAPFRRKDKDRKPPDQHQTPGRKPGHPPAHRPEPPQIDDHVEVRLVDCPHCHGPVTDVEPCEQFIEDLPPVRPHVTRLITYTGQCPRCGEVRSTHPMQVSTAVGAAKVHLGARALGLAAFLNKHLGLPMRPTCRVLWHLGGLRLTPGGLAQTLHRVAEKAKGSFLELVAGLRSQPVVYADETSWWVGGAGSWLWTFTTPDRTIYRVENSRGKDVVFDTLGAHFAGVLTSDCLASYENLPYILHKCYAHHLKAIAAARDRKPEDQRVYFNELKALLHAAMMLDRMRGDLPPPKFLRIRQQLDQRADALILPPRSDPDEERVANRLRKRRRWLFTFLDHPGVEATNNRAERALRPAVIARKLSCGNKTQRGKRTWEILASRPAIPIRAWLSSILLLASVCGLAGWMSWDRSGESLAARVEPQDWDISFRPPRRFEPLTAVVTTPAYAIAYRTPTASGEMAELVFRRFEPAQNLDSDEICNLILRPHASLLLAVFAAPPTRTIEKLGPLDAVQVHYPGIPMVVRAIHLQNGDGYAVSLRVEGGPIDEPLYRSFDLACRAVDFKLGSGAGP